MNDELNVSEALKESFYLILRKPVIILPIFIVSLFNMILDSLLNSFINIPGQVKSIENIMPVILSYSLYIILYGILFYVIYTVVDGMYPLIVKSILEKNKIEMISIFKLTLIRAPTLIIASILVGLIISVGFVLLIIPGVFFTIWYFYTIPAIMLDDRGVLDGMERSKEFASNKKFKTLLLILVPFLPLILIDAVRISLIPTATETINLMIYSTVFTWASVVSAYVYIKKHETGTVMETTKSITL